jgi:hypothetical protein
VQRAQSLEIKSDFFPVGSPEGTCSAKTPTHLSGSVPIAFQGIDFVRRTAAVIPALKDKKSKAGISLLFALFFRVGT